MEYESSALKLWMSDTGFMLNSPTSISNWRRLSWYNQQDLFRKSQWVRTYNLPQSLLLHAGSSGGVPPLPTDPPLFSPEQLSWIDSYIMGRTSSLHDQSASYHLSPCNATDFRSVRYPYHGACDSSSHTLSAVLAQRPGRRMCKSMQHLATG